MNASASSGLILALWLGGAIVTLPTCVAAEFPEVRLWSTDASGTMQTEPANLTLAEHEWVAFSVSVQAGEPIYHILCQWLKDGQPLGEASDGLGFQIDDLQTTDAGRYSASVSVTLGEPGNVVVVRTGEIGVSMVAGLKIAAAPANPVLLGQPLTLTALLPGFGALQDVRWRGPEGELTNVTSQTLNVGKVAFADAGKYAVRTFNPRVNRSTPSAPYTVSVYPLLTAPEVVIPPRDQAAPLGAQAVFTVGATGSLPLSYQWQQGRVDVPNATNFYLTRANVTPQNAGSYRVRVSNTAGEMWSAEVALSIAAPPTPNPQADALVAQGRAALTNHTANGLAAAAASFGGASSSDPGHATANLFLGITRLLNLAHRPGVNAFLDRLRVLPAQRDLYDWTATPLMDQRGRLRAPPGVDAAEFTAFVHGELLGETMGALGNLLRAGPAGATWPLTEAETAMHDVTLDQGDALVLAAGIRGFQYLAHTLKSWNLELPLAAIEAFADDPRSTVEAIARDYPDLLTFADPDKAAQARAAFIHGVELYVQAAGVIYSRPPGAQRLFNLEPEDRVDEAHFRQTLLDLKAALTHAVILNEDPEWRIRLGPIVDGTRSPRSLAPQFVGNEPDPATLPAPAFADAVASLGPPRIILHPVDRAVKPGSRAELAVLAFGAEPLMYQWSKDDRDLPDGIGAKYIIPAVGPADVGEYRVQIANAQGAESTIVEVRIVEPPSIAVAPVPVSVKEGRGVTLHVQAAGGGPLSYQWYHDGVPVPGGTGASLTLADARAADAGQYTVRIANGAGSVVSGPVTVQIVDVTWGFTPPLLATHYDQSTYDLMGLAGPSRTVHDGNGGVYVYFQLLDMVAGRQAGSPLRLRETDLGLDPTFQLGTKLTDGEAVAVQPDGKILVAGRRGGASVITRVDEFGSEDPTFQVQAFTRGIRFITVQPDGRILLAITHNAIDHPAATPIPEPTIWRLLADGRPDPDFIPPVLTRPAILSASLYAPPVLDGQGRIYLGGVFVAVNGVARTNFARLLPNGALDTAYVCTAGIPGGVRSSHVRGIGLQSDGGAVVAGDFRIPANTPQGPVGAIRFDVNGNYDPTFHRPTYAELGLQYPGIRPRALLMLPDDRFLLVANMLVRLNRDGTVDPSFARASFGNEVYWISQNPDGRLFVPGVLSVNGRDAGGIAVFSPDGQWDERLNPGGFGLAQAPTALAPLPEGRLAVAGLFNRVAGSPLLGTAILDADGRLARRQSRWLERYSEAELVTAASVASGPAGTFYQLLRFQDAESYERAILERCRADGELDESFALDPAVGFAELLTLSQLYAEPDGKVILVAGRSGQAALYEAPMIRLNADGSADPTFRPSATTLEHLARVHRFDDQTLDTIEVGDLRVLAGNAVRGYLAGLTSVDGFFRFIRLRADGSEDPAFSASTPQPAQDPFVDYPLLYDPVTGRMIDVAVTIYSQPLADAVELPDGGYLICGGFSDYDGQPAPGLVRLRANGALDTSFQPGPGPQMPGQPLAVPFIDSLEIDVQGRVYLGGLFSAFNGVPAPGIARVATDGAVDSTFHSPVRMVDYSMPASLLALSGDDLWVGGTYAASDETFPRAVWRIPLNAPQLEPLPSPLVGTVGGSLSLTARPLGDGPFSFQWQRNGDHLPATDATLVLPNLSLADAGEYRVIVSNASASTTSNAAQVRVVPPLRPSDLSFGPDGSPQLVIPVFPGVRTVIEASTDLGQWSVIADVTPQSSPLAVHDQAGRGAGRRFYRVLHYVF